MSRFRPVRPSSRQRTSMEAIREGSLTWAPWSAESDVELKLSEPAKRIRSGDTFVVEEYRRRAHRKKEEGKDEASRIRGHRCMIAILLLQLVSVGLSVDVVIKLHYHAQRLRPRL